MPHPRLGLAPLVGLLLLCAPALSAQRVRAPLNSAPMRVLLLVDSSSAVSPMLTDFRAGLRGFLDTLPDDAEVAFLSTGGQLRIRVPPTTDREALRAAAASFSSQGGANAFLESLLEADQRFLKNAPLRWGIIVILTTDAGEGVIQPRIEAYNAFAMDFVARGGRAHGIVIQGKRTGVTSEVVRNLVENTGGVHETVLLSTAVPARMRELAYQVAEDEAMRPGR